MKYTNREAAERIVSAICNALPYLPSKEDWKKLIDFTENQINRQTAQQSAHPTVRAVVLPKKELSDYSREELASELVSRGFDVRLTRSF